MQLDGRIYFKWKVKTSECVPPSDDVYRNISNPRGGVYIFNYLFTGRDHEREGAKMDTQNLKILFSRMGYEVRIYEDYTKEETLSKLKEIRRDQYLRKLDSFVCIILSHGRDGNNFCTLTDDVDIDEVRYLFIDSECPQLKDKPKIFLVNFCRGQVKETIQKIERDFVPSSNQSQAPQDMFTVYSSIKNFQSLRHTQDGTLFVQGVCQVFAENAHSMELTALCKKLCITMNELEGTTPEGQNYGFKRVFTLIQPT